jgi:hypothetical protein
MALGSLCLECSQILNKIQIFAIATIAETQRSTFPSSQPKLFSRSLLRIGLPSTTYKKSILRRDYDDHSQVFLAGMKLVWPRGKKQLANRITHKTTKITIHPKCKSVVASLYTTKMSTNILDEIALVRRKLANLVEESKALEEVLEKNKEEQQQVLGELAATEATKHKFERLAHVWASAMQARIPITPMETTAVVDNHGNHHDGQHDAHHDGQHDAHHDGQHDHRQDNQEHNQQDGGHQGADV